MVSVWSVSKLSTEYVGSRRELVANCVHTADADATKQFRCVLGITMPWPLINRTHPLRPVSTLGRILGALAPALPLEVKKCVIIFNLKTLLKFNTFKNVDLQCTPDFRRWSPISIKDTILDLAVKK